MNDIDKMPSKCRDCAYWELATYPWCCGDCKDMMNPKNGEYIKRIDAKRALTALSADLDAETVQRCIEAMNNPKAADVEPKRRWIPVTERLPERGRLVLTAIYGTDLIVQEDGESLEDAVRRARSGPGRVEMGYLDEDGYWTETSFGAPMMVMPRYWMPLPEPPEEEKEENMDKYTIAEEAYKRGYADGLRDAGKPRVLDYDEIADADAVWLEIRHTNAIEIEVTAFKTCGERMMGFEHGFFQSIPLYGKQWRCWSKKPTREQMEKEEWNK